MTTQVYIPTLNRPELIEKTLPFWEKQDADVTLVIDPVKKQENAYAKLPVDKLLLPGRRMGMGAIRQFILEDATDRGLEAFVMSDDDAYPYRGNIVNLCHAVLEEDVVGCGACYSYHGLMIGNEVLDTRTRFPIAGGYGHTLVGINVTNALFAGGYPKELTAWGEDTELQRRGIVEEMPWYYSTEVELKATAKRFAPGGLTYRYPGQQRERQELKSKKWVAKEWPEYVSQSAGGRLRFQWKKFQNDYDPTWADRIPKHVRRALARR